MPIILSILFWTVNVSAYPSFIGYKYSSCVTCHYNSFGNGPLNDYGRMIWATTISGKLFYSSSTTEDDLAEQSGFLGTVQMPDWIRPSVGYRGMYYTRSVDNQPKSRYITMQAEANLVLKFGSKDQFYAVGTYGYAPKPISANPTDPSVKSNTISREHYISYALGKTWRIFLGMMDKVYGLRVPDHVAFSRDKTLNSQNDQVHGLTIYNNAGSFEWGLQGFGGNLYQEPDLRLAGGSGMIEYETSETVRLGLSVQSMKNNYVQHAASALHGRFGFFKGSSMMLEIGTTSLRPVNKTDQNGVYGFLQNTILIGSGFHFLNTFEYYTEDTKTIQARQFRFSPGFQYFPSQRAELRVEFINSRNFNTDGIQNDTFDLMSQLHLWF